MAQCEKAENLKNLDTINQKSTIIAVNPGGTNEHFVNANLMDATIVRTPDNIKNIQMIRDKEADMMITDMIEGNFYQYHEPENFCVTNDHPFVGTENYQIYMTQKDNTELMDNLSGIAEQWGIKLNQE